MHRILIHICLFLLLGVALPADARQPLSLQLDSGSFGGGLSVRAGTGGGLFVLDRGQALLYRIDPASGRVLWQIDGSESGETFIDPAWLSRPDGFYVYLTDRGTRRVWRVDYRGEIRGAVELSFAADPVILELAAGGQMVVYDRAAGMVHLLDDSGRQLWSFPPGEGRTSQEPAAIAVGPAGQNLFLLWQTRPELTVVSLFGRSTRQVDISGGLPGEITALAAAGTGDNTTLGMLTADSKLYRLDTWSGELEQFGEGIANPRDICAQGNGFLLLAGSPPLLHRIEPGGER